jgi:hypothetical protein
VVGCSSFGVGVLGSSNGSYGVSATTYSTANNASAVYATLASSTPGTSTSAVYGENSDTGTTGIGVYGAQAGGGYGLWGEADGSAGYGVYGVSSGGYGVVARGGTYSLHGIGNFAITGGTRAAIVPFADGKLRTFYCLESPECWFEDFGSANLKAGACLVKLDPQFAEAVDTGEYHVFLSPEGDCKGLFVTAKTATGFQVREQASGTSNVRFSYRIVALRADVDAPRLAIAPDLSTPKSPAPPRTTTHEALRTQR